MTADAAESWTMKELIKLLSPLTRELRSKILDVLTDAHFNVNHVPKSEYAFKKAVAYNVQLLQPREFQFDVEEGVC